MRSTRVLAFVALAACSSARNNGDDTVDAPMGECTDGAHRCMGATYQTCTGGTWTTAVDCPVACDDMLGCVQCVPGTNFCQMGDVYTCDATGNPGGLVQQCTGSTVCSQGTCVDACADAATNKSYIGCEYWAVDLDNAIEIVDLESNTLGFGCDFLYPGTITQSYQICFQAGTGGNSDAQAGLCDPPNNSCPTGFTCGSHSVCMLDAQHSPFAIVVSNPQSKDVHVVVTGPGGQTINQTISAGQVSAIKPQMSGMPDASVDGTIQAKKAYELTSDLPVVAYQFNPLDNSNVFSNDASLLIPRTAFDLDYYGMAFATLDRRDGSPSTHSYYGYLTVVAWQDNTQITVTPTAAVQASATQTTIAAGVATNFTLNAFDVLQLESSGAGDLSGTHITAANGMTFGVFGGHEATAFGEATGPSGYTNGPCCADHLEEMLFPSSTWGMNFAIARSQSRGTNEPDYLRVMAQKAGTSVTFTPAPVTTVTSNNCNNLGPGEFCDVKIAGDTAITSNNPILVGHYLESAIWSDSFGFMSVGSGDPSMAIAVPVEQFRSDYTILIPNAYAMNYLSIAAPATGGVTVDNNPVTLNNFPGGSAFRSVIVPVTAGQHTIHCADTCSVLVYGYDSAVSYMFAGGLDLKQIVIQ